MQLLMSAHAFRLVADEQYGRVWISNRIEWPSPISSTDRKKKQIVSKNDKNAEKKRNDFHGNAAMIHIGNWESNCCFDIFRLKHNKVQCNRNLIRRLVSIPIDYWKTILIRQLYVPICGHVFFRFFSFLFFFLYRTLNFTFHRLHLHCFFFALR